MAAKSEFAASDAKELYDALTKMHFKGSEEAAVIMYNIGIVAEVNQQLFTSVGTYNISRYIFPIFNKIILYFGGVDVNFIIYNDLALSLLIIINIFAKTDFLMICINFLRIAK